MPIELENFAMTMSELVEKFCQLDHDEVCAALIDHDIWDKDGNETPEFKTLRELQEKRNG